ncbi:MAG: TRL-like family protein [Candidatus Sumerlaeia bacterium]|nr:TRL-like family protein [Candidatus Sumerlaeia bacterium]
MKRSAFITATVAVLATTFLSGCLVAPVQPPMGILYTDYNAPLFPDQTTGEVGSRSGEASSISIVGLVALGDASLQTAAQNGNIKNVRHVDYNYKNYVGIYQKYTTIARGE